MSLLSSLFGSSAAGNGVFPLLFPNLFGSGKNGVVNFANVADVGYLGAFGAPQYSNATIPAGVTLTVAPGSSNGGLIMAVSGTLTISGSIVANGANGSPGAAGISAAGGATAGGGAGAPQTSVSSVSGQSNPPPGVGQSGHGCLPNTSRGAGGGVLVTGTGGAGGPFFPQIDTGYPSNAAYDQASGLRCNPSTSSSGVAFGLGAFTTQPMFRSVPASALWPGNRYGSLNLLPSGCAGTGGANNFTTNGTGFFVSSGGGGGGGGLIYIEANTVVFNAGHSIQANGGNGGAAAASGSGNVVMGGCGGDGGMIVIVAQSIVGTPNLSLNGGTGGAGAGTSAPAGLAGFAGRPLLITL